MIDALDEVLRRLLIREIPIKNGEIDIQFKQPNRNWSAQLSRPTLNLYLYDLRENIQLRQPSPLWSGVGPQKNGKISQRLPAVRLDLHYVMTVWVNEPTDEHHLLARALMALFRYPYLPEDLFPEILLAQPSPIQLRVAQPDHLQETSLFWSALDNEIKPSIDCTITCALDPYQPITTPLVRERVLIFRNVSTGATESPGPTLWTVEGRVAGSGAKGSRSMSLLERGLEIPLRPDGSFTITNLPAGTYTVEISASGAKPWQQELTVPSPEYLIG